MRLAGRACDAAELLIGLFRIAQTSESYLACLMDCFRCCAVQDNPKSPHNECCVTRGCVPYAQKCRYSGWTPPSRSPIGAALLAANPTIASAGPSAAHTLRSKVCPCCDADPGLWRSRRQRLSSPARFYRPELKLRPGRLSWPCACRTWSSCWSSSQSAEQVPSRVRTSQRAPRLWALLPRLHASGLR